MIRRDTRWGIAFVLVGLLTAAGAAYLIVSEIRTTRTEQAFEDALSRVDRLIEERDLASANEALRAAAANARSRDEWLSTVKRAYRVAEETERFETAARLAVRGADENPADGELIAVAVHASLRAGRSEEVFPLLEDAPDTERFAALRAEAMIRSERKPEVDGRRSDFDVLAGLSPQSPPSDFSQAFELTENSDFAVDEALRRASTGDLDGAFVALEERNLSRSYPVFAGLLAYDLERYQTYESMLGHMERRTAVSPEQLMLQADVAMLRQNHDAAASIYRELRRSRPAFSPLPYLNGAWLERSQREEAVRILDQGEGRFGSHTGVARADVLLTYSEDSEAARELLRKYVDEVRRPAELATLEMHLFERKRGSVSSFISRLWMTANTYPDSPFPFRYLGWYLVSTNNWTELEVMVDRAEGVVEEDLLRLYRGILAARGGEWDRARALFYGNGAASWHGTFNAGLSQLAAGSADEAHELFEKSLELLSERGPSTGRGDVALSRARVLLFDGLAYGVQGKYSQAYRRTSEAVELDPKSERARYLMTSFADRLE